MNIGRSTGSPTSLCLLDKCHWSICFISFFVSLISQNSFILNKWISIWFFFGGGNGKHGSKCFESEMISYSKMIRSKQGRPLKLAIPKGIWICVIISIYFFQIHNLQLWNRASPHLQMASFPPPSNVCSWQPLIKGAYLFVYWRVLKDPWARVFKKSSCHHVLSWPFH